MKIRRDVSSIPLRSAEETWDTIVDLVTGTETVDRDQLLAAKAVIADFLPQLSCYADFVRSLADPAVAKLLGQARVVDAIKAIEAGVDVERFEVLRHAPPRRLESYKKIFKRMLELTPSAAVERTDLLEELTAKHHGPREVSTLS